MTNFEPDQNLGFSFRLGARFTPEQRADVAKAFDYIIQHHTEIVLDARMQYEQDITVTPQTIEAIEKNALKINDKELSKTVSWLTMYIPDIPCTALVAALYMHNNFIPPDIDGFQEDDNIDFVESEHGKETGDYYEALCDVTYNHPQKEDLSADVFQMAAKVCLLLNIYSTMDIPERTDYRTFLRGISSNILNQSYERAMYLKNLAGDLGDPFETFFEDHISELQDAMDDVMNAAITSCQTDKIGTPQIK
jgi:hypothetical protein